MENKTNKLYTKTLVSFAQEGIRDTTFDIYAFILGNNGDATFNNLLEMYNKYSKDSINTRQLKTHLSTLKKLGYINIDENFIQIKNQEKVLKEKISKKEIEDKGFFIDKIKFGKSDILKFQNSEYLSLFDAFLSNMLNVYTNNNCITRNHIEKQFGISNSKLRKLSIIKKKHHLINKRTRDDIVVTLGCSYKVKTRLFDFQISDINRIKFLEEAPVKSESKKITTKNGLDEKDSNKTEKEIYFTKQILQAFRLKKLGQNYVEFFSDNKRKNFLAKLSESAMFQKIREGKFYKSSIDIDLMSDDRMYTKLKLA